METLDCSDLPDEKDSSTDAGNISPCRNIPGNLAASMPNSSTDDVYDSHSVLYISDVNSDTASYVKAGMNSSSLTESMQRQTNRKMRHFVPTYRKDEYYWIKRKKNNEAARKSREKRRLNDAVLARTVMRLLKENNKLKRDLLALRVKYKDIDSAEVEIMERYLDEQQFVVDAKEGLQWDEQQPILPVDPYNLQQVTHNPNVYHVLREQCGYGVATSVAQNMHDERIWKSTNSRLKEEDIPNGSLEKMSTEYNEWKNQYITNFDPKNLKCEPQSYSDAQCAFNTHNPIQEKINCHERIQTDEERSYYFGMNLSQNLEGNVEDANYDKKCDINKPEDDPGDRTLLNETSTDSSSSFESCHSTPAVSPKQNNSMEDNRFINQERAQKLPYKLRFKLAALQS